MTTNPVIIDSEEFVGRAEQVMLKEKITTLIIGSAKNRSFSGFYQIYTT
ncbi:CBS domain-containing protein [Mucilaginibacter oryzae]|nr:hypothetical protein [Mucilaginibacter oryzae]